MCEYQVRCVYQKMNRKLIIFLLVSASLFHVCHGFGLGNIGDAITNGIKSAFWSMVYGIGNALKSTTIWAAKKIKDTVSTVATDMFAALSAAGEGVRQKANATLSEIADDVNINQTAVLLKMMHTGPLPMEYYLRKIDLEDELQFLDELVEMIKNLTIVCGSILGFCVLCMLVLFCCYCMTKKDLQKVDELEKETTEKLAKQEVKRKKKKFQEAKQKAEKRKEFLALLMQGGGPMGFASGRPPPGLY